MSDETKDDDLTFNEQDQNNNDEPLDNQPLPTDEEQLNDSLPSPSDAPAWDSDAVKKSRLHGMFRSWFLDYASYVILDRAVPYIEDGLKPVQRRILHTMSRMEDGRYNKVANIVGATMAYHPHGDASIYGALVALGQKQLTVDTQGNWGNILTGDSAAAPRYIEARLTKFALDVVFDPKVTVWKESYDGRNQEPVTLPVRFPLLLAQGGEGIGVGLASVILPHNFNELIDASINYLQDKPFELYPDFPTGGTIDVSRYNDGRRGGKVRIRAKIEKRDAKTLVITEIPFSVTTNDLMDSIQKANEKKIKIKKIDDNTAATAEIILTLPAGSSPDKTIDALYAFTKCEDSISPNACVIVDRKPQFMGVSDILRYSTDRTVALLKEEQQIRLDELMKQWHTLSLEKIFIEERIYKDREFEEAKSTDEACTHIDGRLRTFIAANLAQNTAADAIEEKLAAALEQITRDDVLHLLEIKMARILRFNSQAADDKLIALLDDMRKVQDNIDHIIDFTIAHFRRIKKQYGAGRQRLTEIRSFDNIVATKVAVKNEKLYFDAEGGFMGYGLKKGEFVSDCSDIDDVIIFYGTGHYVVKRIGEKVDIGQGAIQAAIFRKNDTRTIYNAIYLDGESGITYAKRFFVNAITRDRDYDLTLGTPKSRLLYFSINPNGEGELLKVLLKPKLKLRNVVFDYDMSQLAIKGRTTKGNVVTKNEVHKIVLKRKGGSTLGGRKVWFEPETLRLNPDGRGTLLGEFSADDLILIINSKGEAITTSYDFEQHFDDNILRIEKFDPAKVWTAVYWDAEQKYYYVKRFRIEPSNKPQGFIGDSPKSKLVLVSDEDHARIQIVYGGGDKFRGKEEFDAFDFIGEKSIKAKGKRATQYEVQKFVELEPLIPTVRTVPTEEPSDDPTPPISPEPDDRQETLF